ncbi:hypothetical protein [Kosakonia sp. MH5]|uniref:hypothetical protein n=1 Tax=Kosakonia sp. MH5 TaxID=2202822 RepID=UPI001374B341|nr:hypothetical protein [Kosakonia sp. MH5]NCF07967.1 hypothetical protein [Kosakonia sp. MH5]
MKRVTPTESKRIFIRGLLRFLKSIQRKKNKNKSKQGLYIGDIQTPIKSQVGVFIEKIAKIRKYDSSVLNRSNDKVYIPRGFDMFSNPEKTLLFVHAITRLVLRGKRKSITLDYKKNRTHCLGAECLLGVALTEARQHNIYLNNTIVQINGTYPKDSQHLEIIRDIGLVNEISVSTPGSVRDSTAVNANDNPKKRIFKAESIGKENASAYAHDKKNITAERFTSYINDCLKDHNLKLVESAAKHLKSCMAELLDNAERHCGIEQRSWWYLRGFVNNSLRSPNCEIVVFNFGKTISETFQGLPEDHFSYSQQVLPYVEKHIDKAGMFEEGLTTVAALQGRVSCKNQEESDSSGTGTIELLKLFQDMHDNIKNMSGDVKGRIQMSLISGAVHINFDGSYKLRKRFVNGEESDIFTYPFNNDDLGLEKAPDKNHLKKMKDANFPGVMINIRFPLPENAVQRA